MSTLAGLEIPRSAWEVPAAKPLDEAVWEAWIAKGAARDRRGEAVRLKAVKWISIAGLLAAAGVWVYPAPYDVAFRFAVAMGAFVVMLQAFQARRYVFAALFAGLVLLFNPLVPVFNLSGGWQRALVAMSAAPFVASLVWLPVRLAHND